jgi:hypothetical protein
MWAWQRHAGASEFAAGRHLGEAAFHPNHLLFPAILAFSSIGIYSVNGNSFDLYTLTIFGIGGLSPSEARMRAGAVPSRIRAWPNA